MSSTKWSGLTAPSVSGGRKPEMLEFAPSKFAPIVTTGATHATPPDNASMDDLPIPLVNGQPGSLTSLSLDCHDLHHLTAARRSKQPRSTPAPRLKAPR